MIGIIIAMKSEFIFSKQMKSKIILRKNNNEDFFISDNKIVFTYSGIGKDNSAIASQNLITNLKLKTLINIGSAGALSEVRRGSFGVFCEKFFAYMLTK